MNRSTLTLLAKLLFAGGLIAWVVHNAGWDSIVRALTNIDRTGCLIGMAVMVVANVVAMLRWHLLMRSVQIDSTPWSAVRLGFVGLFFNNVMPGLTGGDLVKAIYITREHPRQRTGAVVSVVVDRIIGIIALTLIAAVVIPFDMDRYGSAAIGTYSFLAAAIVGSIVVLSRRVKSKLREILRSLRKDSGAPGDERTPSRLASLGRSVTNALGKIDEAVSMYRNQMGAIAVAMVLSIIVQLLLIFGLQVFGDALADGGLADLRSEPPAVSDTVRAELTVSPGPGVDPSEATRLTEERLAAATAALAEERRDELNTLKHLSFGDYCSVIPIINIISAIPISPPSGWGVGETLFQFFFFSLGVAKGDSVALSFTYRITNLLISLLGGVALLFDRRRVRQAVQAGDPQHPH